MEGKEILKPFISEPLFHLRFPFPFPGRDGLQQRGPAVPPAGDRKQRGSDVLRRGDGPAAGEEEEEEEEGAGHPDHRLNINELFLFDAFVYKHINGRPQLHLRSGPEGLHQRC